MQTAIVKTSVPAEQPFVYDLLQLRARTKSSMAANDATSLYRNQSWQTLDILQTVLATEIVCMLRYTMIALRAADMLSIRAKREFLEHARDEHNHIERTAARITQLGGQPDFNPRNLETRASADDIETGNLIDMIEENLVAERIACEHYRELIQFFATRDKATCLMLENVLEKKEEHALAMHDLVMDHERRQQLRTIAAAAGSKSHANVYAMAGHAS